MLSEEQGIQAIIELQAKAGVVETREQAKAGWENMLESEKVNTEYAYTIICGGFKKEK